MIVIITGMFVRVAFERAFASAARRGFGKSESKDVPVPAKVESLGVAPSFCHQLLLWATNISVGGVRPDPTIANYARQEDITRYLGTRVPALSRVGRADVYRHPSAHSAAVHTAATNPPVAFETIPENIATSEGSNLYSSRKPSHPWGRIISPAG